MYLSLFLKCDIKRQEEKEHDIFTAAGDRNVIFLRNLNEGEVVSGRWKRHRLEE